VDQHLPAQDNELLRSRGLISSDEIAIRCGDLIVAENVTNQSRRIIDTGNLLLEGRRRVLKG